MKDDKKIRVKSNEEIKCEGIRDQLLKLIERNPIEAKTLYSEIIHPWLVGALNTVRMQDDLLIAAEEEDAVMLACNGALIVKLKEKGIDLPNLDEIGKDARARVQQKYKDAFLREQLSI